MFNFRTPKPMSYQRQADAVDFLVDIECIDVCHSADVVDDCHDARLQVIAVNVVLAAEPADELFGLKALRAQGGVNHLCHKGFHDFITREFNVKHGFAAVYFFVRHFSTFLIRVSLQRVDILDNRAVERTIEDVFLVFDKGFDTFIYSLENASLTEFAAKEEN